MAKEPRATDGTTPKKRTRKSATEPENGTKVVSEAKLVAKSKKNMDVATVPQLEDQIRARAYELYLQRGGQGGSPEQDWFQAAEEIYGQSVA